MLRRSDFTLDTSDALCLKCSDPTLVLVHTTTTDLRQWNLAASQVVVPQLKTINVEELRDGFMKLKHNPNHPLFWMTTTPVPFIVEYRGGWPQKLYSGPTTSMALIDYALSLT